MPLNNFNTVQLNPWMLIATLLLFLTEVLIATKLGHHHFIRAYFGDFLVVILVYCAIKSFFPITPKPLAIGVFIFAAAVELAQCFQIADHLQLTGVARVVVGTSFSFYDLVMYAAGSLCIYWIDVYLTAHKRNFVSKPANNEL